MHRSSCAENAVTHLKGRRVVGVLVALWLTCGGGRFVSGEIGWVPIGEEYQARDLHTVYVDVDAIVRAGHVVVVRQLTDYRLMQGNAGFGRFGPGPHRFFSTVTKKEFHCADKRVRLLAFTEFSHHMGTGQPADGYVDPSQWIPIEPGSLNEGLWKVACVPL